MAAATKAPGGRPPTRQVRLRKILIVDPDSQEGSAMRLALEEAGYYLNLVRDPVEGCRRVIERVYDLVIISASSGQSALQAILQGLAQRPKPPPTIVVAGPDELAMQKDLQGVPCLTILRRPCAVEEIVEATRTLVGPPWPDVRTSA